MYLLFFLIFWNQVVHLDSSKASVQQARRNAEISGLSNRPVRWIVDDCVTFVDREIRRRQKDADIDRTKGDDGDVVGGYVVFPHAIYPLVHLMYVVVCCV